MEEVSASGESLTFFWFSVGLGAATDLFDGDGERGKATGGWRRDVRPVGRYYASDRRQGSTSVLTRLLVAGSFTATSDKKVDIENSCLNDF